jgi:hypothetical protein
VISHDEHLITAVCDELWIIRDKRVNLSQVCMHRVPLLPRSCLFFLLHHSSFSSLQGDFQEYKNSILEEFRMGKKHEGAN